MISRFGLLFTTVTAALLACAGIVLAQPTGSDSQQAAGEDLVADASSLNAGDTLPNRYIVVLKDNVEDPASVAEDLAGQAGLDIEVTHTYENALKGFAARIPDAPADLSALQSALQTANSDVDFVARDSKVEASAQTLPTGVNRIEADQSSTKAGDGSEAVDADVAIIDTGIYNHPDLNRVGGYDCTSTNTAAYSDGNGHGTHVAGSAAARDDASGVVGAAPGARLWAVKVLGSDGSGTTSSVICGIDWVTGKNKDSDTTNDIEVANMSLGGYVGSSADDGNCGRNNNDAEHRAICGSVGAGVFYAVAAGNSNDDLSKYVPAAYDEVLTTTAMSDSDGQPGSAGPTPTCRTGETDDKYATFSNYATTGSLDQAHTIAAPGVCITSTWLPVRQAYKKKVRGRRVTRYRLVPGYNTISGTSMASPHVAGTAALCIATNNCTGTPKEIMDKLRNDAQQRSDLTATPYYGFTGDPNRPSGTRYYGYLEYAGSY